MDKIDELKIRRITAWQNLKSSSKNAKRACRLCESLQKRFLRDKEEYESIDRQLAMIDGRLHILEPRQKKIKAERELSLDEINELLVRLGVSEPEPEVIDYPPEQEEDNESE